MARKAVVGIAFLMLVLAGTATKQKISWPLHEAEFYEKLSHKKVRCLLCPHRCVLTPGQRGLCRVRINKNGKLYSMVYSRACTVGKEPIEKAPFFHFLPGRKRLTLATAGCNQRCKYCQNWEISQSYPEELPSYNLPPEKIVEIAEQEKTLIICFTYSEPIIFYEYMCDIAQIARKHGIRTAVVSGGYINPEPLKKLCGLVDAIKIDLKGFTNEFYKDVCGSSLQPVLDACKIVAESGTHLELVNLVIPVLNDDTMQIRRMCSWIHENLGNTIPIHFTRFTPAYRLRNSPPTPVASLEMAARVAKEQGLKFVYIGNVPGHKLENTHCPKCDSLLIRRRGFTVLENRLKDGCCPYCGTRIPGVWK